MVKPFSAPYLEAWGVPWALKDAPCTTFTQFGLDLPKLTLQLGPKHLSPASELVVPPC